MKGQIISETIYLRKPCYLINPRCDKCNKDIGYVYLPKDKRTMECPYCGVVNYITLIG